MINDKIRKEFETWRDEKPNQRYGAPVWDAWQAGCASKQKEIDHWKDLESQAARFVEAPIVMRTHFTGEPPYVGWEGLGLGLGLALTETLDELSNAKKEIDNFQAKLDALMLEYCPEYMEDTQLLEWERNQRPVNPEEVYSPHTKVIE